MIRTYSSENCTVLVWIKQVGYASDIVGDIKRADAKAGRTGAKLLGGATMECIWFFFAVYVGLRHCLCCEN